LTSEQLKALHAEYRHAIEVARDEAEPEEARDKAAVDAADLRLKLDEGIIEATRDAEIGEARSRMDDILRPVGEPAMGVDPLTQSIREFCRVPEQGVTPVKRTVELPIAKRADEEWFKDTAKSTKAGYLYTSEMAANVIFHENAESGVLASGPTYVDTDHGRTILYPKLATDAGAAQTAERTAATLTYPVMGQGQLDSYRQDGYMTLTEELARDTEYNVWPIVTEVATRALATQVASQVAAGTGTTMPDGLPILSALGKTAAAKTTFTYDELTDLYLSLLPGYRARGSWICGSTAFATIFKMKDADGRPFMQAAPSAGMADTLMGHAIREDSWYPAQTTGLKPVTFGDVSAFHVRRIGGVRIERDDGVYFTQFESVVRFACHIDSTLFDLTAVKHLILA
jgi:HK97 family phage major capsid protein